MVWVFSSGKRPGLEFCCSILKIYNNILGVLDDREGREKLKLKLKLGFNDLGS